ncbi:aldehyde dehydrogenase family protein [Sinorhizobium medicae]|uniref:aldehyde dehydrogenase family protein n=1 Tax=Sinorhizobium medicae TaxID=110321 RepID=UPI000FDC3353|nr:aldehyde dehydrogenase family protein [Sinorhizobium medicae]RVJ83460.1 aldehyde dehydrogenase family protein [Sinorhizobium medicae]
MPTYRKGLKDGAEVVTGGVPDKILSSGNYVEPTVLRNVARDMSIAREEIFGPVITVHTFEDIDEAAPFGGFKESGIGREGGPEGLAAFLETKAALFPS